MPDSKTSWMEKGAKPTKYFLTLEKRNNRRKKKNIEDLELLNGKQLHKADKIIKEIENF